jgi:transposase
MYRKRTPAQPTCFIPGTLSDYIPEDHILRRVQAVLDLSWLAEEVKELYSEQTGRPCIDPEQAVRLMLAGFFHGVVHDRKLMREAQVNLAYRWFAGYELDEPLPDHSSLTRIRQRWGEERFREIFERSVSQCAQEGLVGGDLVHVDASLMRADVSWRSLVRVHVSKVLQENEAEAEEAPPDDDNPSTRTADKPATRPAGRPARRPVGKQKKVSTTDPDASMATGSRRHRLEPSYKQHTAVDDTAGVIVDVHVTTGEASECQQLLGQLARVAEQTGQLPQVVTADSGRVGSGCSDPSPAQPLSPPRPPSATLCLRCPPRCRGLPHGKALAPKDARSKRVVLSSTPGRLPGVPCEEAMPVTHCAVPQCLHQRRLLRLAAGAAAQATRLVRDNG